MKKFLKNNKGLTGADAILAIALIILFSGIIATISYNIYITSNSLKRSSQAIEYITSIFENAKKMDYEDVIKEKLVQEFNEDYCDKACAYYSEGEDKKDDKPYKVKISVEKYNEQEENKDKKDLIKEIKVTVKYKLGTKEQTIEMKTVKTKEAESGINSNTLEEE